MKECLLHIWLHSSYVTNHVHYIPFLQFIREYSGKVDELIKHKIETMNEEKAKESEEKDIIKQQVYNNKFLALFY